MINFRDRERSKRVVRPVEPSTFEEPVSMVRSVRAELKPAPKITERQLVALIVTVLVVGTGIILAVLEAVAP